MTISFVCDCFSLICRSHQYRWRDAKIDLCSTLIAFGLLTGITLPKLPYRNFLLMQCLWFKPISIPQQVDYVSIVVSVYQGENWFCWRYSSDIYGENTTKAPIDKHILIFTKSHHGGVVVERSPCMGGRGLILGQNRPKSLKHVVASTAKH